MQSVYTGAPKQVTPPQIFTQRVTKYKATLLEIFVINTKESFTAEVANDAVEVGTN